MSDKKATGLTIGEVSRRSGISSSALRYYESERLLPEAERRGGKRRYKLSVLTQLSLIQLAKGAGFTISEIRTLISGFERRTPPGKRWLALGEQKIAEVGKQIHELQIMKMVLLAVTNCKCANFEECAEIFSQQHRK